MMKIKTTFKYALGALTVLILVCVFAMPNTASADWDDYGLDDSYGFNDYSYQDYPIYDQYYDTDYSYQDYPIYDQYYDSYDSDVTYQDYPIYDQYYSSPSYSNYDYQPSYSYQPQSYQYQSYQRPQSTPYMYTPAPNYVYQYTTPATTNVNTNVANSSSNATATNTNVNNNNNVNNNPINIVINGGTPVNGTVNPPQQSLDGNCYISPTNVFINQDVTFTANATGGNGNYTYSWSGSDGISSNSRTFTGRFSTIGPKTATVIIYSNGQSISRTCSANVETTYVNNNLSVYCIPNPTSATVGQSVIWTAYVTGGNTYGGYNNSYGYTYSWSGTDGLSFGNSQAIQKTYSTGGLKTATVTVYGNGQSQTATCSMTVSGGAPISNVTVIREPGAGNPVSGVFLSQVPATGISFGWKVSLFILGLLIWSGYVGYVMVSRRKRALATAGVSTGNKSAADRINQFKLDNMRKKGLIQ
jgi:hypothetical protein